MLENSFDDFAPANYGLLQNPNRAHFSRQCLPYRQFAMAAALYPNRVALLTADRPLTFGTLLQVTEQLATGLLGLGLAPGEAAAIVLQDRWEHVPLFLALARVGGVHVTIGHNLPEEYIRAELAELRPRLLIGNGGVSIEEILSAAGPALPEVFRDDQAPLAIRFSSGSTGQPKKTVASHRAQALVYQSLTTELQLSSEDVHLAVGSLAHAALQVGLAQLMVGGSVVVRPFNKETVWQDCVLYGITNIMLMPTMVAMALEHPGEIERPITIVTMGATLALPLKRKLAERFRQVRLYDIYASTELSLITSLRPSEQMRKPTSAGRPHFSLEVAIFDDDGNPTPVGETGNIYGRGPMCISNFIGTTLPIPPPGHLAANGWIRSGDLGFLDEDGFLYIRDRRADLILSGGERIFPSEVEGAIREFDGVREVAVIGVPDERLGQRVVAYVESRGVAAEIIEACSRSLDVHTRPQAIFFVDDLPRTASAKISRYLVRQRVVSGEFPS